MVNFIFKPKCFKTTLRYLKGLTYKSYENNLQTTEMKKKQFLLYSFNKFSWQNQEAKSWFLTNIFSKDDSLLNKKETGEESRIPIKKSSFTQRHNSVGLKGGINSKKTLFENSFRYSPFILNIRFQSTSTTSAKETSNLEINESVDKPWFSTSESEGVEGILKDISECELAKGCQNLLEYVHTITGLPWWGTIILTSVILRTFIVLPFAIHQVYSFSTFFFRNFF